jgi:hypothetical protein
MDPGSRSLRSLVRDDSGGLGRIACNNEDTGPHSRGTICPSFAISLPSLEKRRRESRAPTAPAVPCAKGALRTHTGLTTGTARTSRLSPRNGFTAYTCSPRGSGLSCPRCAGGDLPQVAPGSRRQDHTISPYAAAFSSGMRTCLTPQRPSQPAPTCRDDRDTSLRRHGVGVIYF